MKRITANVRGRVQGVAFRYYTRDEALRLGITGWVKNNRDGSVSLVAEGASDQLQQLLGYLQRGPRAARVEVVESDWSPARLEYESFEIRW